MNIEKWERFKRVALGAEPAERPVALIVDSPWIPGHLGLSTLDYISVPEVWLEANLRVEREFPEVTFLPGFWAEFGMCAEPSAFGCRLSFYANKTPVAHPVASTIEEALRLTPPNPLTDGLMPLALNAYRRLEPRVNDAGHVIKMVAARGPLTVATHLMGVTDFLLAMKVSPEETHRLLRTTTTLVRDWLDAQLAALKAPEAILVLDDIAGFMSAKDYLEFAHPYLKEIFDAFPVAVKMFHNDTDNAASYGYVPDLGIHIFNWTHRQPVDKVRRLVGPGLCLMGNVAPLETLAQGTPEAVRTEAHRCVAAHGHRRGLLLSAGGGVSPGTPGANLAALIDAARSAP